MSCEQRRKGYSEVRCGYEFRDHRVNWKFKAKVFVRDERETIQEIHGCTFGLDGAERVLLSRMFYSQ